MSYYGTKFVAELFEVVFQRYLIHRAYSFEMMKRQGSSFEAS